MIAGQGTIGLELAEQLPDVATFVVPIGGGGLASGIAIALRALRPDVRIVGVQAGKRAADDRRRHRREVPGRADVGDPGRPARRHRHVEDEEIADAITLLLERAKLVVEGAGAASVAALLGGKAGAAATCARCCRAATSTRRC